MKEILAIVCFQLKYDEDGSTAQDFLVQMLYVLAPAKASGTLFAFHYPIVQPIALDASPVAR